MGRVIAAGAGLGLLAIAAILVDYTWIAAMAGTLSICIWAALVADTIFSKRRKVYVSGGFSGPLEKDTKITAHRGEFVTIHPARGDLQLTELRGEQRRRIFEELGLKDELIDYDEKKGEP